jgi:pilus assembly protein CpaB
MYAGEPILSAKLMASKDEPAPIPEGFRAIPVKVDLDTVVGLIQPGDLVDVMVFLRAGPDVPRAGAYTILRMARVYAVNSQTDRDTDSKGHEVAAKTVSLLVKPKQAERLTLATEMGKIRLALRRPSDDPEKDEELERDLPAIFRDGSVLALEKTQPVQPVQPVVPAVVPKVEVAEILPVAIAPVWTMRMMTPTGFQQFDWSNEKDLPQEGTPSGSSPAPKTPAEPSAPSEPGAPAEEPQPETETD